MTEIEVGQDTDINQLGSLLTQLGIDVRTEDALPQEITVAIDIDAKDYVFYEVSLRVNATDEAQFNEYIDDLIHNGY